ncbi:MAG: hypothetical protein DDT35_01551 [Firmicutes bacterium]|nr:hypothetical protein [Bacillota bacterium]
MIFMQKRLYRSRDNRVIAGVCGGLADYFGLDSTLVRVGMAVLVFFDGMGLIAYIAMALIVPKESMRVASPTQVVEANIEEMADTAEAFGERMEQTFTSTMPQSHAPRAVLGGALVVLGAFLLLRNFNFLWWIDPRWLWPGVLILGGLAVFVHGMRRKL